MSGNSVKSSIFNSPIQTSSIKLFFSLKINKQLFFYSYKSLEIFAIQDLKDSQDKIGPSFKTASFNVKSFCEKRKKQKKYDNK